MNGEFALTYVCASAAHDADLAGKIIVFGKNETACELAAHAAGWSEGLCPNCVVRVQEAESDLTGNDRVLLQMLFNRSANKRVLSWAEAKAVAVTLEMSGRMDIDDDTFNALAKALIDNDLIYFCAAGVGVTGLGRAIAELNKANWIAHAAEKAGKK